MSTSCFNGPGFKKIARLDDINGAKLANVNTPFGLHWKFSDAYSVGKFYAFAWTPICLSGPYEVSDLYEAIHLLEALPNFGGAYLQTRVQYEEIKPPAFDSNRMILAYRTTFHLDQSLTEEEWFGKMKSDSRQRFKKAKNLLDEKQVVLQIFDSGSSIPKTIKKTAHELYCEQANIKQFADCYKFNFSEFSALIEDPNWILTTISLNDQLLGMSIMGRTANNLDYTFAVNKCSKFEISRALILSAFRKGKALKSNICLGGGINENDKLAIFKQRMGTSEIKFGNIKLISQKLLDDLGKNYFSDFTDRKWPNV